MAKIKGIVPIKRDGPGLADEYAAYEVPAALLNRDELREFGH